MRAVIQRVSESNVTIDGKLFSSIQKGLMILLGVEVNDSKEDAEWLCRKIVNMRIFADENNLMNLSIKDVDGEVLIISQFTLHADASKGNRPSYIRAARPETAISLYEYFIETMKAETNSKVLTGSFGADMKVSLINDGPVTIILDSKAPSVPMAIRTGGAMPLS